MSSLPSPSAAPAVLVLSETEWRARARAHENRVRAWTDPHQDRAARAEKHPVHDFLFTYYGHRPSWLRRWFPGPGVALAGAAARDYLARAEYQETGDGVTLRPAVVLEKRRAFVTWLRGFLAAVAARPPFFGCFGLHEWAMVYRQTPDEVRHNQYPLRFPPDDLAAVVESQPLRCTHYDAFRFFSPPPPPI